MRLFLTLTAVAALCACGNDRTSNNTGDAAGAAGAGDPGEQGAGPGDSDGDGVGAGGQQDGGGGGAGEGEGEAGGEAGGGDDAGDVCEFTAQECPEDLPKAFTYSYRTADCVSISFDYIAAPQPGLRPVILLLHEGIRGFRRNWEEPGVDHFIDSLRCAGYTVINADLRGHLQSKNRLCQGWPGENCEAAVGCVSGVCGDDGRCADPESCDAQAETPECAPEGTGCDPWGRCLQEVEKDEDTLSAQRFSNADWEKVAGDIASMFEFFDILANLERTYVFGEDGNTTGVQDELDQTDFPELATAFQEAGFEPNGLDVEIGFFVRINIGGQDRNYSIRSVAGNIMTFRSDKEGDWGPTDNEDGFYATTPLTEELTTHPWLLMQRANLPFDPERFGIIAPGLGGNAALRYAAREDSRSRATVVLSPVLAGADGLEQRHLRELAGAVEFGGVLALAGSENERGVSALEALEEPANAKVQTQLVRGVTTAGIALVEDVGVTNDIKCWLQSQFDQVE